MANSYTQLHVHFVFAVKYQRALIDCAWKEELHKYITGVFQKNDHKMLQINSMPDHIHMLGGLRPAESISSLIQNVKSESSKWIRRNRLCGAAFNWQDGYGAFAYSKSDIHNVIRYIQNQEAHHKKVRMVDEFINLLKYHEIDYDPKYIFKEPE